MMDDLGVVEYNIVGRIILSDNNIRQQYTQYQNIQEQQKYPRMSQKQLQQNPNPNHHPDAISQVESEETATIEDQYQQELQSERTSINVVMPDNNQDDNQSSGWAVQRNRVWILLFLTVFIATATTYVMIPANPPAQISTNHTDISSNSTTADTINKKQLTKEIQPSQNIQTSTVITDQQNDDQIKPINNQTALQTLLNVSSSENAKNMADRNQLEDGQLNPNNTLNEQLAPVDPETNHHKLLKFFRGLKNATQYTDSWKINSPSQLPFCIIINPNLPNFNTITQSIYRQNYSNYIIINQTTNTNHYLFYRQLISSRCQRNTLILFLHNPLKQKALRKLNYCHQKFYTWVTYAYVDDNNTDNYQVEVYSFYSRVYDLLQTNDFQAKNMEMMNADNWTSAVVIGMMELCQYHNKHVQDDTAHNISPLSLNLKQWSIFISPNPDRRVPYSRLYKLSQDYPINITTQQRRLGNLKLRKNQKFNKMTIQKITKAIHLQQSAYLPTNHLLNALSYQDLSKQYKIDKHKDNQLPFCITVMSYNNNQNSRNIKALQSIIQQQYTNYHIVFVDDNSEDMNLEVTRQYLLDRGFNLSRVTFVQNTRQNYATYNIINAAFNFCNSDQIQVLLDGDDQYIGRYVFLLLNAIYRQKQQKQQKWIVYTNSKSNLYTYGTSQYIKNMNQLVTNFKRKSNHFISPVRSWRVQLLYHVPLSYHLMANGKWLDTVYDTALQHSIVELSGVQRTEYVPEIMYEYNKEYGNNDDSSKQKLKHRKEAYDWVLKMKPLNRLKDLTNSVKNPAVKKVLDQDRDMGYFLWI